MRDIRNLVSWEDFREVEFETPTFWIAPYVPTDGIVLLWGETSTGKSPVGWHMASAIGRGDNFFGLPARQGKVLYLEVDTHQRQVHERVKLLDAPPNVDFLFLPPLSVPEVSPADQGLLERAAARDYDVVIINTLRKVHSMDDKDTKTPQIVYSYFQRLFPGASLIFVHHTRKANFDYKGGKIVADKESFSGANNWLNDAQVGLLLQKHEEPRKGINLILEHQKTQVSPHMGYLGLYLSPDDGTHLRCPKAEKLTAVYEYLNDHPDAVNRDIAEMLGCTEMHASRLRHTIVDGHFPGWTWLGIKGRDEELDL